MHRCIPEVAFLSSGWRPHCCVAALPLLLLIAATGRVDAAITVVQQYMQFTRDVHNLSGKEIGLLGPWCHQKNLTYFLI